VGHRVSLDAMAQRNGTATARPTMQHVTARYQLAGRLWVRRVGVEVATDALQRAGRPGNGIVTFTKFGRGFSSTYGGRTVGQGETIAVDLANFARGLGSYAEEISRKGEGLILSHGISRNGGRRDAQCAAITFLWGDCDGTGEWRLLH